MYYICKKKNLRGVQGYYFYCYCFQVLHLGRLPPPPYRGKGGPISIAWGTIMTTHDFGDINLMIFRKNRQTSNGLDTSSMKVIHHSAKNSWPWLAIIRNPHLDSVIFSEIFFIHNSSTHSSWWFQPIWKIVVKLDHVHKMSTWKILEKNHLTFPTFQASPTQPSNRPW